MNILSLKKIFDLNLGCNFKNPTKINTSLYPVPPSLFETHKYLAYLSDNRWQIIILKFRLICLFN